MIGDALINDIPDMNKKSLLLVLLLLGLGVCSCSRKSGNIVYRKESVMIPMRDGVKLYTVILSPVHPSGPLPFIIWRTPYGADHRVRQDTLIQPSAFGYLSNMAKEGYIFVYQDIRGKFKSEGTFMIHKPITHRREPGTIDESTDTYDAIDWLVKNIPGNNGKAGIVGISYPGWLALAGAVDPHPALKAASEQACMGDLFLGDDFHHNGAFRLSYGMEYTYATEYHKDTKFDFPFPAYDLYDWYLNLGPLKNVNEKYFHDSVPTWNNFVNHPDYDKYWKKNSTLDYVKSAEVPMLHVGGYYDQEDINGPQLMYEYMERSDSVNNNYLILGPWNHGQWSDSTDHLGRINFGSYTTEWFKEKQKEWFDYWLKNLGDGNFREVWCFQTGSNEWKSYDHWPPVSASVKKLYAHSGNRCSFAEPDPGNGYVSYYSDPARPVPYRPLPIEATYGPGSRWYAWQVDDQRFVYTRPDVVSFTTDILESPLTVTGDIVAHLYASTSGTDADWIVKLIDVYPRFDTADLDMSQYQFPVAMEVFRGRYRRGFSDPGPLVPGKPEEFTIDLHEINHVFLPGHRIMVQVQSTWFPVIDRNPQKFVPNIFMADKDDFIRTEQRIYFSDEYPTHIDLPVMRDR